MKRGKTKPRLAGRQRGTGQPTPVGQRLNALKHGAYAYTLLMPGEDPAAYEQQRTALYRTYRPQTVDEARCVETLAECGWLHDRYLPLQARFDAQWQVPEVDAAGRLCEPPGHIRVHSSIDVMKQRLWNERALTKAREQLLLLQKQRRLGLIEGAVSLPAGCYMDRSGAVIGPVQPQEQPPETTVICQAADVAASGSTDDAIPENREQKENGAVEVSCSPVPPGQIYPDPYDAALARVSARRAS